MITHFPTRKSATSSDWQPDQLAWPTWPIWPTCGALLVRVSAGRWKATGGHEVKRRPRLCLKQTSNTLTHHNLHIRVFSLHFDTQLQLVCLQQEYGTDRTTAGLCAARCCSAGSNGGFRCAAQVFLHLHVNMCGTQLPREGAPAGVTCAHQQRTGLST